LLPTCEKIWNSSKDVLKEYGMQVMHNLDEAAPSTMSIAEVKI
jgi:hypothetical protein